ncbi:hypothetical protein ACLOAV_010259 [Pseudogymnoascus australis]
MSSSILLTLQKVGQHLGADPSKVAGPVREMLRRNWYLGFTCFGRPAVHFQIFRDMFVDKYQWIDDQMVSESRRNHPSPSTNTRRTCSILWFSLWSLPGAIAAYALAVGVSKIDDTLPASVYALLSGLNAATRDHRPRSCGSAGMLYNALWYFPILMVAGGCATIFWDYRWGHNAARAIKAGVFGPRDQPNAGSEEQQIRDHVELQDVSQSRQGSIKDYTTLRRAPARSYDTERTVPANLELRIFSWKLGAIIIAAFLVSSIIIMVLRGTLPSPPLGFSIFSNLYLAGTIIFGGGPVVIPLLREYVVTEGWVPPRNFLLGLAICQAFPGPNFNFAVYLSALAVTAQMNTAAGAVTGFLAIYTPGIVLHTGTMGLWKVLRGYR